MNRFACYDFFTIKVTGGDMMTLGEKIQKLRKQQGLSQEALAEKVSVTRQTISKWELDQSTPNLDFISQLCDIFSVTADYLIKEEMIEPDEMPYKKRQYHLSERRKRTILILLSAAALAAICICLICDYFIAEKLSWSMISASAILAGWFVILPLLTAKEKSVFKTLLVASIVPVPLLAILALFLKNSLIFTMGICITCVSVVAIWIVYEIFRKCHKNLWRAFGYALLVMIPTPIAITYIIACFIPEMSRTMTSNVFNSIITFALSLVFFGLDYLFSRKREETNR
ncbi:MAG: helix-turn-helix domain-containing protein [Clostridiales bacterium]|nr:helix-turn-helix domain-containing protein [Clostridiales bacterium]